MGLFDTLTTDGLQESEDRVGGGFQPLPSNVYPAVIKLAYAGKSRSSEARSVTIHADAGGQEFRETIYVTNGKGENFYVSREDGKTRIPLPGFTTIDELCLIATGEPLSAQPAEEKVVKLYNFDEKKEIPTPVPVLTKLIGKPVKLGILREIVDKTKLADSGKYEPTGETRTQNTLSKVFHPETNKVVNEYRHKVENAEFHDAWVEANANKDRNRAKGASGGGKAGSMGSGSPKKATESLFG